MSRTRSIAALLPIVAALCGGSLRASAQPCELPAAVIEASSIGSAQEGQIRECVTTNVRLLESDDRVRIKQGREALLAPLKHTRASVSFRLAYGAALTPELERLAAGENEPRAINAMIVAGALGTTQGAGLLQRHAADPRVAVRFSAMRGLRRTFVAIAGTTPAMPPADASALILALGGQLAAEKDPDVFDAAVRALITAAELTRPDFAPVRVAALNALARQSSERARTLPVGREADRFLRSLVLASAALRAAAADQQLPLPEDTNRHILEVGADLWAYVVRRIEGQQLPRIAADDPAGDQARACRALAGELVAVGQANLYLAGSRLLTGEPFRPQEPATWIREGTQAGDSRFVQRARELIGPGGTLSKPPFGYENTRFLPR